MLKVPLILLNPNNMRLKSFLFILLLVISSSCSLLQKEALIDLEGTTWRYADEAYDRDYRISFLAQGRLLAEHPNERTPDNDYWEQHGNKLIFTYNDGYSVSTGLIISSDYIRGKTRNEKGVEWEWEMRLEPVKEAVPLKAL